MRTVKFSAQVESSISRAFQNAKISSACVSIPSTHAPFPRMHEMHHAVTAVSNCA